MSEGVNCPGPDGRRRWTPALGALLLLLAVLLVYVPRGLVGPMVWDDVYAITLNDRLKTLWPPDAHLWSEPETTSAGRPVLALSLALNYAVGGLAVRGYHAVNVTLHLLNVLLWWALLTRVLQRGPGAALRDPALAAWTAALLWAVHPLATQPVAYIVQRGELLVTLFYLLTLLLALPRKRAEQWQTASWGCVVAAGGANLLGMLSKEVMVTAPLAVVLLDYVLMGLPLREMLAKRGRLYVALALGWAALAVLVLTAPRGESVGADLGLSRWEYLTTQAGVLWHYLRLVVWPSPLVFSYAWPTATQWSDYALPGLGILLLLALTSWGCWRRRLWALAPGVCFLVLAPSSSVFPVVTELAAERRMYLPLALLLGLAAGGWWQLTRPWRRVAVLALPLLLALGAGCMAWRHLAVYQSGIALWRSVLAAQPRHALAHDALAVHLLDAGDLAGAQGEIEQALALEPRLASAWYNRGQLEQRRGQTDAAIAAYRRATELRPGFASAEHNLAVLLFHTGQLAAAEAHYRNAVTARPAYGLAWFNLGVLLYRQERFAEAISCLRTAQTLQPRQAQTAFYLGLAYAQQGDIRAAAGCFARVLELDPQHADARANLEHAWRLLASP